MPTPVWDDPYDYQIQFHFDDMEADLSQADDNNVPYEFLQDVHYVRNPWRADY